MSLQASADRFRPVSVPVSLFVLVVATLVFVPPLVLGEVTFRTYAIATAVFILAVSSVFPYAVVVAVGTLPLLYLGFGTFASPTTLPAEDDSPSMTAAVRHVVAGIAYVLASAVVGGVGLGADFAVSSGSSPSPLPSLLIVGGVVVASVFVGLQLWRYDGEGTFDWRTVATTVVLGGLLALSPSVALWVFGGV
ncbi:hypothetical protein [Natronomonas gomsonensis]|uniref:hypothetical protein n=1 Tax=Natronomonas gomsonensis TaxID=1046043 RepID=UPI0015BB89B1|nr:hypothetical protein [Natronomonas gomsonensis]